MIAEEHPTPTVRRTIKRALLHALKSAGVYRVFLGSRWRRERLAILCYHGIALDDEHLWAPALFMDAARFESRLQMLCDGGYCVLPLAEAVRRLYERTLPPKSVVITFDDGTYDFYSLAFPLLRKYRLPATLYLTTFYCQRAKPVFRIFCDYLLWKGRNNHAGGPLLDLGPSFNLRTETGRRWALSAIGAYVRDRKLTLEERDLLAERLARALGLDYESIVSKRILQVMNPTEVSELAAAGQDIQLHTHRHRTPLNRGLFVREIADNQQEIWEMTGAEAMHFCYPSGVCSTEFLPWLREQGIISATTCESGLASAEFDPLLLPRILDTGEMDPIELESWLTGVGAMLSWRKPDATPATRG